MKTVRLLIFLLLGSSASSQPFLQRSDDRPLTFADMQRQFRTWKETRDVSGEKYWKYWKRWEQEMQFHTDASGEPADAGTWMNELLKVHQPERNKQTFSSFSWTPEGPFNVPSNETGYLQNGLGRINCVAFHPVDSLILYAGVAQGGVWKSTDGGQSWMPLTDQLPLLRISDICIDPVNPDIIYISLCDFEYIGFGLKLNGRKRNTHYGLGVYKSTDGGQTWAPSGLSFQLTQGDASLIRKIIVHPVNNNKLVACGTSGMYLSDDAGTTWTRPLDTLFWDLVQDPANPDILFAASGWVYNSNEGYAGIYKSIDFGQTWTLLNTGITPTGVEQRVKLAIAPSDPDRLYAVTVNVNNGLYSVYRTSDGGFSWQAINPGVNFLEHGDGSGPGGQGTYDLGLAVDPLNKDIVYAGGINFWASFDGAISFEPASHWTTAYGPTIHADIHQISTHPITGDIYVCSDGGIDKASEIITQPWNSAMAGTPWSTAWTHLSNGMCITSFYRISSSKSNNGVVMAGAQDNATAYFDGTDWRTIFGGDGMDNWINPMNSLEIIGSSQYGYFQSSTDGGFTSSGMGTNPNGEQGEWTTPIIADESNPGRLYCGFENVQRSDDYGNTWIALSALPTSGSGPTEISALEVAPSSSSTVYVCKRVRYEIAAPGRVYKTTNSGASWSDVTTGLPDSLYYTSVAIHEQSADVAWVSMAGLVPGQKVFRTDNGGSTWQNISYNLPNLPVNCVKQLPGTTKLIAATDAGVYVLDSISSTWIKYSSGLPNVIVTDIEINSAANRIYLSTFGRGIWSSPLSVWTAQAEPPETIATLFPNPAKGIFTISLNPQEVTATGIRLEIIDITGKRIHEEILSGIENKIDAARFSPGAYFVRLTTADGKSMSQRLIVQR